MPAAFTAAGALRDAMTAAAETAVADTDVQVVSGFPYPVTSQDVVAVGAVRSRQEPAAFGNRSREESLEIDVMVSVFRPGGQEQEAIVTGRAYDLLGAVERYCRVTDTTLGGAVRYCFLTAHEMESDPWSDDTSQGRACAIRATFTAQARITG